jgi:hypothetical protein
MQKNEVREQEVWEKKESSQSPWGPGELWERGRRKWERAVFCLWPRLGERAG